ncbi:hypothetical protein ACFSTI_20325 [Rhizorhabdus histidinilytica]|uniref:Uncharacterized protein n=1 Tax=Rhizorhabdus histidinilytica TaxID=439228 RepID=A0A1T5BRG9_9SPHN|nr:hypothetical protein [Rhizorhabdus histidinilytica]SKB49775.1 hypothetical protein SAMN06295920_103225 [Rhizorhabdus histidinilytica]
MTKPAPLMTAQEFADRAREIVATMRGHAAHRAIDLLTNDELRGLGYGEGIDIFEAQVGHWHEADAVYPHAGPCPDCERAATEAERRAAA